MKYAYDLNSDSLTAQLFSSLDSYLKWSTMTTSS